MMIKNISPDMKISNEKAMEILHGYEKHVGGVESYFGGPFGRIKWMINPPGKYLEKIQENIRSILASDPPSDKMDGSDPLYRSVELLDRRINTLLDCKHFPKRARHKAYDFE